MEIYVVIVLYRMRAAAAPAVHTLMTALQELPAEQAAAVSVLLYDNSPERQTQLPTEDWLYVHDPTNSGLATAYNAAWRFAAKQHKQWILLLDQDTELTTDYVTQLFAVMHAKQAATEPVAIAPCAFSGKQQISPVSSETVAPLRRIPLPAPGSYTGGVMCLNSGLCVRVSFLDEIQGFTERFPLDYLDHWFCQQIYTKGHTLEVLPVALQHQLSVLDYRTLPVTRYQSILTAEKDYYQHYRPDLLGAYQRQLGKRLLKQLIQTRRKAIVQLTWQAIKQLKK